MRACSLLLLLAVGVARCAMAARGTERQTHLVTAYKCCKFTGNVLFFAPDQLGSAKAAQGPPSQGSFDGKVCVQGSDSSTSMSYDCKLKDYDRFDGFTIKPTNVITLTADSEEYCKQEETGTTKSWLGRCNEEATWADVVEESQRARATSLRCPVQDDFKQLSSNCKTRPKVAIFADYDGCWDIISATSKWATEYEKEGFQKSYDYVSGLLKDKIEAITEDKHVILFVGSNRQSYADDSHNAQENSNGRALGAGNAFELWVNETWNEYGDCWELNRALLSDNQAPCSSWDKQNESPWGGKISSEQAKVKLLENGIKQLLLEESMDIYFFDDDAGLLDYVRANAWIPPGMRLKTIQYDWHDYATGKTEAPLEEK